MSKHVKWYNPLSWGRTSSFVERVEEEYESRCSAGTRSLIRAICSSLKEEYYDWDFHCQGDFISAFKGELVVVYNPSGTWERKDSKSENKEKWRYSTGASVLRIVGPESSLWYATVPLNMYEKKTVEKAIVEGNDRKTEDDLYSEGKYRKIFESLLAANIDEAPLYLADERIGHIAKRVLNGDAGK